MNLGEAKGVSSMGMDNSVIIEVNGGTRRISLTNFLDGITVPSGTDVAVLAAKVTRIIQTLGHYSSRQDITLTATETDAAISADGAKVSKSGWAIAEFTAEKGVEYLFAPGVTDGDVCIFSQKVTAKAIRPVDYAYTYNEDGTIATASATYNGSTHAYTFSYDAETGAQTITDASGAVISALPYQYEAEVGTYLPMTRLNASAELPEDGYCRLMSHFQGNSSLTVAVSYKVGSADLTMKAVKDGVFASVATQLGNLSQNISSTQAALSAEERVGAQALAEIARLISLLTTGFGDLKAESVSTKHLPMVCGFPLVLFGAGAPSASVVPENWDEDTMGIWTGVPLFRGQTYIDTSATEHGHYDAVHCDSVGGWRNA